MQDYVSRSKKHKRRQCKNTTAPIHIRRPGPSSQLHRSHFTILDIGDLNQTSLSNCQARTSLSLQPTSRPKIQIIQCRDSNIRQARYRIFPIIQSTARIGEDKVQQRTRTEKSRQANHVARGQTRCTFNKADFRISDTELATTIRDYLLRSKKHKTVSIQDYTVTPIATHSTFFSDCKSSALNISIEPYSNGQACTSLSRKATSYPKI